MILIIDNYDSFTYNIYQMIAEEGRAVKVVRNDCISIEEIENMQPSHLILSPGPGHPSQAGVCVEAIKYFAPKIPILGICLGHQAIGLAFGGSIVSSSQITHGKSSPIFHRRKYLFKGLPLPLTVGRYHSLIIDKANFPDVLEVEAETEKGLIMAIKHKNHPCYGVQFHPESILTPEGKQLLKAFLSVEALC